MRMVFPDLSYNEACLKANLPKLSKRRDTLSQNLFANIVRNKDHNYNCYQSHLPIINLWSFVVTCAHLWLFVVIRGHSCVLLDKIIQIYTKFENFAWPYFPYFTIFRNRMFAALLVLGFKIVISQSIQSSVFTAAAHIPSR